MAVIWQLSFRSLLHGHLHIFDATLEVRVEIPRERWKRNFILFGGALVHIVHVEKGMPQDAIR